MTDDQLEEWYRAAIAETMRLCPEWKEPLPPKRRETPRSGRPQCGDKAVDKGQEKAS